MGDGVSLVVVSLVVIVTSGVRVGRVVRVLRRESAVVGTTVVAFVVVVTACSEVGEGGTAVVAVLVGEV